MSIERVPMTRDGYENLKSQLERMQTSEMIEIAKRIADARALGDLSENAEYHAAREDQGMLQARIDALQDKLARAVIVDSSTLPKDTVVFGTRVRIKDLNSGEEEIMNWWGLVTRIMTITKSFHQVLVVRRCWVKRLVMRYLLRFQRAFCDTR